MKAKSILAAAFVLFSVVAFANESENNFVVIRGAESGTFKVIFKGEEQVRATVNIFDKAGQLVFTKGITGKNGFILPVNFVGLEQGEYAIEVKQGTNTWTRTVNYAVAAPVVKNSSIQNVHVAKLANEGKYLVSISTKEEQFVRVNIFDINDELLHTETRKADGDLAIIFDVKDASGEVKFKITDKAGYSKVIKK